MERMLFHYKVKQEKSKKKEEKKKEEKQDKWKTQNNMIYLNLNTSLIALNGNGLNSPDKRKILSDWILRIKSNPMLFVKDTSNT